MGVRRRPVHPTDRKRRDRVLDLPVGGVIDRIRMGSGDRASVCVDGRAACTLSRRAIEDLGLRAGLRWTPMLALRVARALERDQVEQAAGRLLAVRERGTGEVLERLRRRGVKPRDAEAVVRVLAERGAIDDERFAGLVARSIVRRGPAGPRLIESRLRAKRLDRETASLAAKRALEGHEPLTDALELARKKARTLPASLDDRAKARRILGALARRGFDAEVAWEAARRVLGDG